MIFFKGKIRKEVVRGETRRRFKRTPVNKNEIVRRRPSGTLRATFSKVSNSSEQEKIAAANTNRWR